jgi:RNase P subunit RPR2
MQTKHCETILNQGTTNSLCLKLNKNLDPSHLFIECKVCAVIITLKDNKTVGPDGTLNEQIKAT